MGVRLIHALPRGQNQPNTRSTGSSKVVDKTRFPLSLLFPQYEHVFKMRSYLWIISGSAYARFPRPITSLSSPSRYQISHTDTTKFQILTPLHPLSVCTNSGREIERRRNNHQGVSDHLSRAIAAIITNPRFQRNHVQGHRHIQRHDKTRGCIGCSP